MEIRSLMTKNVITVIPSMNIHKVAELFIENDIGGAPVIDETGELLGIIEEEAIIFQDKKVHLPTFIHLSFGFITLGVKKFEEEVKKITAQTVGEIMDKDFLSISADTSLEDAATLMIEHDRYYCPVVEEKKLVGVITKKDIVKAIAKETE